jgi:hypothetical protein
VTDLPSNGTAIYDLNKRERYTYLNSILGGSVSHGISGVDASQQPVAVRKQTNAAVEGLGLTKVPVLGPLDKT